MDNQTTQKVLRWDLLRQAILNQLLIIVTVFVTIAIVLVSINLTEMKRNSDNVAKAINQSFNDRFNQSIRSMDEIYHLYIDDGGNQQFYRKVFNVFKNADKTIDDIYVLDLKGKVLDGSNRAIEKGHDFTGQAFYKKVPKLGDNYWSSVTVDLETGVPTTYVSKRYKEMIVVVKLSLAEITSYVNTFEMSDNSEICITDSFGMYVVNRDESYVLTRTYDSYIKAGYEDIIITYKGQLVLPYVADIQNGGWKIIIYQSINDYAVPAFIVLLILFVVALSLALVVNRFSYKRLRKITGDLQRVEEQALSISQGNYYLNHFDSDYLEINTLMSTFKTLIENIKNREEEIDENNQNIRQLNENLEEQVISRTNQLVVTNNELNEAYMNLKEAQSMIVQNEKLAALGQMVSGVAHELNTPIGNAFTASTFIKNSANELSEKVESGNIKKSEFMEAVNEVYHGSDIIYRNLVVAADIISNFKQIAADHQSMEWREFNVYELLKGVAISFNIDLRNANVNLELRCSEEYTMKSYPGAMVHIFSNLIRNSMLHGFIGRDHGKIVIDVMRNEDLLRFIYKDDGVGMNKETLEKIYDPFYTTKRAKGGTGLGMNIVYNYVSNILAGRIECESEVGKGSIFRLELPIQVESNSDWQMNEE